MSSTDALSAVCIFGIAMLTMLVSSTDMNIPTIRTQSGPIQLFPEAGAAGAGAGAEGAAGAGAGGRGAAGGEVGGAVGVAAGAGTGGGTRPGAVPAPQRPPRPRAVLGLPSGRCRGPALALRRSLASTTVWHVMFVRRVTGTRLTAPARPA